jgi:hypothetical protein
VADAGEKSAQDNPLRPQERENCGMLGEVLRNAQRFREPRDLVSLGVADQDQS